LDPNDLEDWLRGGDPLEVLEDFQTLAGPSGKVILPRSASPQLVENISAALIASYLGVGLEYAKKRYVKTVPEVTSDPTAVAFQEAYVTGKRQMTETLDRFGPGAIPSAGAQFSDAALRRLPATYFAAGFLFRTGYLFEAHAVLRLFLEQVAWAYAVRDAQTADDADDVSPTKAIGSLKGLLSYVGPLYGLLSKRTHIGLRSHGQFVDVSGTRAQVVLRHGEVSLAEGWILLLAADSWSVVYELTQLPWMSSLQNWCLAADGPALVDHRPLVDLAATMRKEHKEPPAGL
jgi:hypothetical protein